MNNLTQDLMGSMTLGFSSILTILVSMVLGRVVYCVVAARILKRFLPAFRGLAKG